MSVHADEHNAASSHLRVSVACFRWNNEAIETIVTDDRTLPAAIPRARESLDATAERIITSLFACPAAYIEQLYTFSYVETSERETVVTYIALFPPTTTGAIPWRQCTDVHTLPERTAVVLDYAIVRLRAKLEYTSIAFYLMPSTFTLAGLQLAYESIMGESLDKRNFRRRMTTNGMLQATGEQYREGPHRPAALYRFSGRADRSSYLTPPTSTVSGRQESDS